MHPYIIGAKVTGVECVRAMRIEPVRATGFEYVKTMRIEPLRLFKCFEIEGIVVLWYNFSTYNVL